MSADTRLRDAIAAAARTVQLRLGPNAVEMAQRGTPIPLNSGEADQLADAILPLVVAEVRSAAATAWAAGRDSVSVHGVTDDTTGDQVWELRAPPNPYRVEEADPAAVCNFIPDWMRPSHCFICDKPKEEHSAARVDEPATPPADWISDFDDEDK